MSSIPSGALRLGSHGKRVADLQRELGAAGFDPGAVDGAFGQHTAMALKAFQRAKNLAVDGVAGSQTWSALGGDRFDSSPSVRPAPAAGPPASGGKQVTAYVSGQARTITVVPVGNGQFLRADAAAAFKRMEAAARSAGINIGATSGFRSMAQQQDLYRRYLNGTGNLAARPGYSNHQGGIAMDISGINGRGSRADSWLRANAGQYGFRNLPSEFWHYDFIG